MIELQDLPEAECRTRLAPCPKVASTLVFFLETQQNHLHKVSGNLKKTINTEEHISLLKKLSLKQH